MADQLIPLDNSPNQTFQVTVAVDGKNVTFNVTLSYSEPAGYWVMNIKDAQGIDILDSIPLLTGEWPAANILGQYGYLGIGSAYIINASNTPIDYPGKPNLGSDFLLLWSDTAK